MSEDVDVTSKVDVARPRNYAFEALAEVTGTDWTTGRGELNSALKSIREETEVEDSYLLADLIHERAKMYREVFSDAVLTPSALAKHWKRVLDETDRKRPAERAPNRGTVPSECATCGGDRFVVVLLRKPVTSVWMREHAIEAPDDMIEEYAPCPDCNPADTAFTRFDGSKVSTLDPEKVRELMRR